MTKNVLYINFLISIKGSFKVHIYFIRLLVLCLSGSFCFASNHDEIISQDQYQFLTHRLWKEEVAPTINRAFEALGSGNNNVATFRLKATINKEEIYKDFSKFLFVSGGNREAVTELEKKIGYKCYSIYTFYPPVENQPNDRTLRKDIADFFQLVEIESEDFKVLRAKFSDTLEEIKEPYLNDLKLALRVTFQNNTTLRNFNKHNNIGLTVQDIELINTTRENNQSKPDHFNDVFGNNFLLNFADSEQSIRKFMTRGQGNQNIIGESINFDFTNASIYYPLSAEDEIYTFCKNYEQGYDDLRKDYNKQKKELESHIKATKDSKQRSAIRQQLENAQNEYDQKEIKFFTNQKKEYENFLNKWLLTMNLSFELEVFSYFQMCSNCQATFNYDFRHRHLFQRDVLVSFLSGLSDNPIKNCFKTLLLTKDIENIQFPKVKLNVHYIKKYGDQNHV